MAQVSDLKKRLWHSEREAETLKTEIAKTIWAGFRAHPTERLTLYRVVYFFLEQDGPHSAAEIVDFLRRINRLGKSKDPVVNVSNNLGARKDLFSYDPQTKTWNIIKPLGSRPGKPPIT